MPQGKCGLSFTLVVLATAMAPAQAQSDWTGAASSDWFTPDNWNGPVPSGLITANIDTASPNSPIVGAAGNAAVRNLTVGVRGTGTLAIQDGAILTGLSGAVGNFAGSQGTVTVSGTGSTWTNAGTIQVGGQGTGSVAVLNGGTLNSGGGASIGLAVGSVGTVTVSGAGSTWNNRPGGGMDVGAFGTGTLTIANGGKVINDTGFVANIGSGAGSLGAVTVTGAGSTWSNTPGVNVGGSGRGSLVVADGAVVSGPIKIANNAGSTGTLSIGSAAADPATAPGTLTATSISFGAGTGTLIFNHTSGSYVFAPAVSGNGSVQVLAGTTTLTGTNTYSGTTRVAAGTLRAGADNTWSASSAHVVAAGAVLDTGGFNQRVASLDNGGTVSLVGSSAGSTLTVTGAYVAHSVLRLGTGLAGSASMSDRLVLDGPGASASGNSTIQIVNLGGLGALTTGNGIEVVSARNGATTTAQTTKSAFSLANGHVDAGAYEYRLYAADAQGSGENWYLRSTAQAVTVPPDQPPSELPPQPTEPTGPSGSEPTPPVTVPTYRAEVPLLAAIPAQLRQADLAMLGNLHRRIGDEALEAQGADSPSLAQVNMRRAWGRLVYAQMDIQQPGIAQARTDGRVSGLQVGTDLWVHRDWRAGVYVGYLDGSMDVTGNARGTTARVGSNDLQSRYLGAYATWMDGTGMYLDSVLQGGSQHFTIRPDINPSVSGKASSFTASVEAGKPFALTDRWSIEPQAQIAYQRNSIDDVILTGAQVLEDAAGAWIGRLGVRVKGDLAAGGRRLQPYARVNLYRANFGDDAATFVGPAGTVAIQSAGGYSAAEAAAGATLALTLASSLYGEIGRLWNIGGDASIKSSVQASVGIKASW